MVILAKDSGKQAQSSDRVTMFTLTRENTPKRGTP